MSIGNLSSYRGSYTTVSRNDGVNITTTFEDFAIFFTTGTVCQIKIKVDGSYIDTMLWHSGYIYATDNIFDLSYSSVHSYYDGVDPTTAENPSILKLGTPVYYGSHAIEIEVANVVNNELLLEAIAIYKNSSRKNVRDIDTTLVEPGLRIEPDVENRRNEAVVVGAFKGLFMHDGLPVNPNNPLYEHTYAKVTDSNSIYNANSSTYVGRRIPMEIYNTRILQQDRADHIALNAMKTYRQAESKPSFSMPADPRIDPNDALGFREIKLNVIPEGERIWVTSYQEQITQSTYKQTYTVVPREPIPSYETREEPDWNNFNQEPIINIVLKSQGFKIAGDDATISGNTVTIGTSPGWDTNLWTNYYFYDNDGQEFKITANAGGTLTIDLAEQTPVDGNWSISFDPFDTDQKGAPLEIHYDQVINAKVEIWIKDKNNNALARVNDETAKLTQEWGEDKVEYWSGVVKYNTQENKAGCYVSPHSAIYENPLQIVFNVIPEDPEYDAKEIKTNDKHTNGHDGKVTVGGEDAVHSSVGSIRIYPKLLYDIPCVRVKASGNSLNSEDVHFRGYVTNTQISGNDYILTLAPSPGFTNDQYKDYLLGDTAERVVAHIKSNTVNTVTIDKYYANGDIGEVDNFVMILGQNSGATNQLIHDTFRSTDNENEGLKLVAELVANPLEFITGNIKATHGSHWGGPNGELTDYILFHDGVKAFYEGDVKIVGQQYFDRGLYATVYYNRDEDEPQVSILGVYNLMPKEIKIIPSAEFRISADLTIYKITKYDTGQYLGKLEQVGQTMENYIVTEGFIKPDEWSYFLNPTKLIIEGGDDDEVQNVLLHNTTPNTGLYFLFEFTMMDRAGRFTNNAWDFSQEDPEKMKGAVRPFGYLIGWQPEDSTRNPYTKHWYGPNESEELVEQFIPNFPSLFRELMIWQ